jgi:hypothetical protein
LAVLQEFGSAAGKMQVNMRKRLAENGFCGKIALFASLKATTYNVFSLVPAYPG